MPAETPIPLTLPWYFTATLVALWLATVAGAGALAVRRLRQRRARRRRPARARTRLPANLRQ